MQVRSLSQEDPLEKEMATRYSCLEKPPDRGACWATVHETPGSRTRLKRLNRHIHIQVHSPTVEQQVMSLVLLPSVCIHREHPLPTRCTLSPSCRSESSSENNHGFEAWLSDQDPHPFLVIFCLFFPVSLPPPTILLPN